MEFSRPFILGFTGVLMAKSIFPSCDMHTHVVYHGQNLLRAIVAVTTTSGTGMIFISGDKATT